MYEQMGAKEINRGKVTFRLFYPDRVHCPRKCDGCVSPEIAEVQAVGTFHKPEWDLASAPQLMRVPQGTNPLAYQGVLYELETEPLADDFYDYRYYLTFKDGTTRWISDPCTFYEGDGDNNSGFVIGGRSIAGNGEAETGECVEVRPISNRLSYRDLIIYELNIDDFTSKYRGDNSPLRAVRSRLKTIRDLGFNAIEFMPWTGWLDDTLSWGYNPSQYFSVSYRYTHEASNKVDRLSVLADVINDCHDLGMQVIMDGVFNHAEANPPDSGFGYYWMYQVPADSPFVGNFADAQFFRDLEYSHGCTLDFILDVCRYWIDVFKIDGIRFDNTKGLYAPSNRTHGLPALLAELRQYTRDKGIDNFALILEHEWDYSSIDVTNVVGATSCWYDMFRSKSMDYLEHRCVRPDFMRMLDSGRDFQAGAVPTTYIQCHDHKAFVLKASADRQEWWRMQPYLIALFTCSGAVMIHNGQEYANSYDMPESGNGRVVERPIDWMALGDATGTAVSGLMKKLIALRTAHPALRSSDFYPRNWDESQQKRDKDGFGLDVDQQVVVYHRWGNNSSQVMEQFYVVLNFSDDPNGREITFNVADSGDWKDLLTGDVFTAEGSSNSITVQVGRCWGRVLFK